MLTSVKIQKRQSEIRQSLAALVGKDKPDENEIRSMSDLDGEYQANEAKYRAALIVEDTERREAKGELDRFCDAMIEIRREIAEIVEGVADKNDNVLKHAPHTHALLFGEWTRSYSKEKAFFPLKAGQPDKYWPPVGRVDNVFGDRNLVCTCPPMEEYQEAAE